ncbi:MAG: hypothetical protein HQ592_00855 [Planctomycetes bacterium]|nr:hypothetical protein [Planctomycetota bacterium]
MTLPRINLDHFFALCDDTGIFQHGVHGIPDPKEGYCTDDVARAIIFLCRHPFPPAGSRATTVLLRCVSFLNFANQPDGTFHNFLSYDRRWCDMIGSEDCQGRGIWAAATAREAPPLNQAARGAAAEIFQRSAPRIARFRSPRALAFAMLGCTQIQDSDLARDMLRHGADFLVRLFKHTARTGWQWFEEIITYCNARMPQALYAAYDTLENEEYLDVAERSLRFLTSVMFDGNRLEIPGNRGWLKAGQRKPAFDQQPVEAGTMVEALCRAFRTTGCTEHLDRAAHALMWYHGNNRLGIALIDPATGACCDALMPAGVNRNQGAEAVLSYLLARSEYDATLSLAAGASFEVPVA